MNVNPMPWFAFIPVLLLVLVIISLVKAILSKSRARIVVSLLLLCVVGGLVFVRATMPPDRRYDPRRGMRYPRYYPDVQEVNPSPQSDARLTAAENDAMLRMLESMPATFPKSPASPTAPAAPPPPGDIVLPIDPPLYRRNEPQAMEPATQPASGKLWVDHWEQFVSSTPLPNLIRSNVTSPAVDPDEARNLAINSLVEVLRPMVIQRFRVNEGSPFPSTQRIDREIRNELTNGPLIVDQHLERSNRPYGSIWTHHMLVDASAPKLDPIARRIGSSAVAAQQRQLTTAAAVGGLSLVIVLLYLFLNFATRGYFVWRLRAAAVMGLIAALLIFISVA